MQKKVIFNFVVNWLCKSSKKKKCRKKFNSVQAAFVGNKRHLQYKVIYWLCGRTETYRLRNCTVAVITSDATASVPYRTVTVPYCNCSVSQPQPNRTATVSQHTRTTTISFSKWITVEIRSVMVMVRCRCGTAAVQLPCQAHARTRLEP